MNKKYWEEFYNNQQPSKFAKFCLKYIKDYSLLVDVGCGNGRDSYFFASKGKVVDGIDYAFEPYGTQEVSFRKISLKKLIKSEYTYDVVYSRFFLHSITNTEIIELIDWTPNIFMAEFRVIGDKPKLFKDHKRNFIDGKKLKGLFIKKGFKILYYKESKQFAPFKNERPLVGRIIAKRVSI